MGFIAFHDVIQIGLKLGFPQVTDPHIISVTVCPPKDKG